MTAPTITPPLDAAPSPAPVDDILPSGWRGPIMPVNTQSGDGRTMVLDPAATEVPCRPLPLPLSAQKHLDDGHDGAVVVGLIRRVWLDGGAVWAEGTFNLDDDEGREWARKVAAGQRWISADLSDIRAEEIPVDTDGAELDAASVDVLDLEAESLIQVTEWKLMGATLCAGPAFETARIEPAEVEATGLTAALTAAGVSYNASDFDDPHLGELTALQVTDDGRVVGHLAGWRSCHTGFQGACVTAPRSASNYRYFHQGAVRLTDGRDLPVGKITLGTGHAPTRPGVGATAAAAHYDNTGSAVAVVRCGEDAHGVWVAGRVLPGMSEQRLAELRRSPLSGDWRTVTPGGGLELVAALAVNVPGFPIPRTQSMAASGEAALVAAGIVTPATARAVEASLRAARVGVLAQRITAVRTRDARARMANLTARRVARLSARMSLAAAAPPPPPEDDGTEMKGGQRIVRTDAGAKRYGVSVGDPIPTGGTGGPKPATDVEKEWEQIKTENPHKEKGGSGGGKSSGGAGKSSSKNSDDRTTKGQVPSGSKKFGAGTPARTSGDTAYMEEDEAPPTSPAGAQLVGYKAGVATYADGTVSDGASWYEQGQAKTSTKTASPGKSRTSAKSATSTSGQQPVTDPITAFVQALTRALAPKPAPPNGGPLPSGPEQAQAAENRQRLTSLLDRLQKSLDKRDQTTRKAA